MRAELDNDRPLFLQVKEAIEEEILAGSLGPDDQIPSNSQLVSLYGINPVTVHKGVTMLLDEGIVYKRRGLGMFVSRNAPARIRVRYQEAFKNDYVEPLTQRAEMLGVTPDELHALVDESILAHQPPQASSGIADSAAVKDHTRRKD
ncbi:MAG: GntR family transcriptional regulator [Coriobacteriales bacterium]|nr:GntR family transcriptional regulator [Coriobacteriales bacterium]